MPKTRRLKTSRSSLTGALCIGGGSLGNQVGQKWSRVDKGGRKARPPLPSRLSTCSRSTRSKVMARCGLTNLAVLAVLRHTQQSGAPPTIALSLHDTRASCGVCLLVAQASEVVKLDVTSERHDVAACPRADMSSERTQYFMFSCHGFDPIFRGIMRHM